MKTRGIRLTSIFSKTKVDQMRAYIGSLFKRIRLSIHSSSGSHDKLMKLYTTAKKQKLNPDDIKQNFVSFLDEEWNKNGHYVECFENDVLQSNQQGLKHLSIFIMKKHAGNLIRIYLKQRY